MAKIEPFEMYTRRYENWFVENRFAYESELNAVKKLLPKTGKGVEVGVGMGHFSAPLGIKYGIEPSGKMRKIARSRGIKVVKGVAEHLPYSDSSFDFLLMVTTICFVDDLRKSLKEAYRVIKPGGNIIVGFVDRESKLGQFYLDHKNESPFYRDAVFYSADEVSCYLLETGFKELKYVQTIFHNLHDIRDVEPVIEGYGKGAFVVVCGKK
jgi:ubiquinone/menaquinone biosynthesis C-methylase UbiE